MIGNQSNFKQSKIYEVEFTSKNSKIHRWTHISKDIEKMFKPEILVASNIVTKNGRNSGLIKETIKTHARSFKIEYGS